MIRQVSILNFLLLLFLILLSRPILFAGNIYYYKDKNGVMHFTDLPNSDKYKPVNFYFSDESNSHNQYSVWVRKYSRLYNLDPDLVRAVMKVESDYNPRAESEEGAQGLMQIMPKTQKDLGLETPFDPEANIKAGTKYLRSMLDRFLDLKIALAAYNAGPSTIKKYQGIPPFPETKDYINKVLRLYSNQSKE